MQILMAFPTRAVNGRYSGTGHDPIAVNFEPSADIHIFVVEMVFFVEATDSGKQFGFE
jgi:hypothetical protein